MAAPQQSTQIATTTLSNAELLKKYQERCRHLNEALEAERAKTSKLRRYISRLNTKPTSPLQAQQDLTSLQTLIEDQNKLIEQLYSENQTMRQSAAVKAAQNQQLLTANEKLKVRIIELRRQIRELFEKNAATSAIKESSTKAAQPVPVSSVASTVRGPVTRLFSKH